jgi:signal transduction histidine kinase
MFIDAPKKCSSERRPALWWRRAASRIRRFFPGPDAPLHDFHVECRSHGKELGRALADTDASKLLEEAITDFAGEFLSGSNLAFRIVVEGQRKPLKLEIHESVLHIAREALSNAWRHARATRIEAEVRYSPQCLRVVVRDDGCGIDPALISSGRHAHLGLRTMNEMARNIGAQLRIWSRPMAGTEVEICARYSVT